jgi:hypothetical protein
MDHRVLGGGGIDVDMATGRPRPHTQEEKQAAVQGRYQEITREAVELAAELQNSPALRVLFEQCRDRLIAIASKDETFMALSKTIGALRHNLEIAPMLAAQEVRRMMGPQMSSFIQEEPAEEPQSAPEGIPD